MYNDHALSRALFEPNRRESNPFPWLWNSPCAHQPLQGGTQTMECKIKNDIGTVFISEDVMLKVAGYAALECYGIVAMSSKRAKDGFIQWLGRENLTKGVQLKMVDDMLDVDLFIIVEYGISISEVCKVIVETVRYKLENMTGIKIRRVNISVEGVRV